MVARIFRAVLVPAMLAVCGCSSSDVTVSGRLLGLNASQVFLEEVSGGHAAVIDSVALGADGSYRFVVREVSSSPSLYNIVCAGERVPLLLVAGEHAEVNSVGGILRNYTVSGSEESSLLREFNRIYVDGTDAINSILERFSGDLSDDGRRALLMEYTEAYRAAKRAHLRFIIEHKERIAAVYALYQRFPGETNLFSADGDIIYYRTVADAVAERWPDSPFLPSLRNDIARMDARMTLLSDIVETTYPELSLPDMYGRDVTLSSLGGRVVLLSFWSAGEPSSVAANAGLLEIYERYAGSGFEIYQVCLDTPKAEWINLVQEQRLPWISVCELRRGRGSAALLYNVSSLPSDFLINADGDIVARDVYGEELERALSGLLLLE